MATRQGGGNMTAITGGQSPIEVTEAGFGLANLQQQSESGEQQTITLDVHQAEELYNWLTQFVRGAREEVSQE